MDNEKFKKILEIVVRVAGAAVLIYFLYNIILTQHEYFSWTKKIPSGERLAVGRNVGGLFLQKNKNRRENLRLKSLAEAVRFELTNGVNRRRFSRPVHSTTLPHFRFERVVILANIRPRRKFCVAKVRLQISSIPTKSADRIIDIPTVWCCD